MNYLAKMDNLYKRELLVEKWNRVRKLRVTWTQEMAQDLEAYHSIDAEAELTALLSEHLAREIDKEIMDGMYKELYVFKRELITEKFIAPIIKRYITEVQFPRVNRAFA